MGFDSVSYGEVWLGVVGSGQEWCGKVPGGGGNLRISRRLSFVEGKVPCGWLRRGMVL